MEGTVLEKVSLALGVSTTTMIVAVGILIILIFIIAFRNSHLRRNSEEKVEEKSVDKEISTKVNELVEAEQVVDLNKEYELVAAIMAALSAHTGKSVEELNIKSIKRINNNSSWRSASINGSHR